MTNIFTAPINTSQQMANTLPVGRAWGVKNVSDSNTRKLINSLSVVYNRFQQQVQLLEEQFRIDDTDDLLVEWEVSVGLPSGCSNTIGTIPERRQKVIDRLTKQPVVTLAQMQVYMDNLVVSPAITIYAGEYYDTVVDPGSITALGDNPKFVIVAFIHQPGYKFEYEDVASKAFEFPFYGVPSEAEIVCEMNKLIPANVILLTIFEG